MAQTIGFVNKNPHEDEWIIELFCGDRKLSIYIKDSEIDYLKSWGPDMTTEMEDGPLGNHEQWDAALTWLTGEQKSG